MKVKVAVALAMLLAILMAIVLHQFGYLREDDYDDSELPDARIRSLKVDPTANFTTTWCVYNPTYPEPITDEEVVLRMAEVLKDAFADATYIELHIKSDGGDIDIIIKR